MSKIRWLIAIALIAWGWPPAVATAQDGGIVMGVVVDQSTQRPLVGAQVFVAGTSRGTITDQDGRYLIANVPTGQQIVRATLIGYSQAEQQVSVGEGATVTADFSLTPSAVKLGGVVVNAITGEEERKRELGTNVANIDVTDIQPATITKLADVLTGRTAGVVMQGVAGTTGTSQRIRIRGANSLSLSNDPLIYIDGVRFNNSKGGFGVGGQEPGRLNDIDPTNIASIEVLKGPAASALYGTAAANGVLLITTKRGRAGDATWNAYVEGGVIEDVNDYPVNIASFETDDPNAPFIVDGGFNYDAYSLCANYNAARGNCTQDVTRSFNTLEDPRTTPFSKGNRTKYGLSVSGGSDELTYYLSGDVEDEQGVIDYNTMDKINLRANFTADIEENLTVQLNSGYVNSGLVLNQNDNSILSPLINGLIGGAMFFPNEAGEDLNENNFGWGFSQADLRQLVTNQDVDRFIIGANANYRPFSWLTANANVGMDLVDRHDFETVQPGRFFYGSTVALGYRSSWRSNSYLYTGNASAAATFDLQPNLVSTSTVGASYIRDLFEGTYCFGAGIVEGTASCEATSSLFEVDEDFSEVKTLGAFFQQELAWNDRVFLAAAIRGDDNSAFGQDFGFIYYPSASLSWVVAEEPWFPEVNFLSTLRLRTAYGESGLRPDFRDAVTYFSPVAVTVNGEDVSAVTLGDTGNDKLEPEKTREYEFGFDAGLFSDRLSVEFTYFHKESEDALVSRPLPPSFGLSSSVWDNLGSIRNSGTELALNARILETRDASFNMRVSATSIDNEIVSLGENIEPIILNRGEQRHQEGLPAGAFVQPKFTYDDADGNGILSPTEVEVDTIATFIGPALPTFSRTLSGDLTLFDFITVTTLFDWRGGNYQLNGTESFRCVTALSWGDRGCTATGDPNASLEEQAAFIASGFYGTEAGYIEDAEFIKWRELSLTLGVPASLSNYLPMAEGASLTVAGRNLATWTDYTGLDPEVNESGGSNFSQNEFNTQPPVRYFTVRLNFTF
ncbi:MAG TPA: SusC/RagA family TonB-linked outer membrane protein [Longimicrobiaceae bacterium]|nr:SusC/RagA family TonB-linked outer membrane protein [Longimicrobiaceae bacterium]